ncbi:MAG TPA: hypothetical protein PLY66_11515 [Acidobacteriota bacterium]|nr:hypothetical protein [Acidobacteriota bacterium]HQG90037.1 hypothetical protein [Acidobacteriota bacterium]HQK86378.1 hypothetical protein [Acidobacteriota bacterium]
MLHYSHTQIGTLILVVLGMSILVLLVFFLTGPAPPQVFVVAVLLAIMAFLFSRLTVEIRDDRLVCFFGPGLIRRSIKLENITGCAKVRNSWLYGWGVRLTPHGWMFNIAGLDAVELTLAGGRRFRIGTDEPDRLCAAITSARSLRSRCS